MPTLLSLGPGFGPSSGKGLANKTCQLPIGFFLGRENPLEISWKLPTYLLLSVFWWEKCWWNFRESCLLKMQFSIHVPPNPDSNNEKKRSARLPPGQQQHSFLFSVEHPILAPCRTVRCCAFDGFWCTICSSNLVLLAPVFASEFVVTPSPPKRFGDTRGVHPFESTRANALQPVVSMGALIQNCRCFWL